MVKKLRFLLVFLILASVLVIGTFAATTTAYVKKGATGTGLSSSSPIGSITDAFGLFGSSGGTIYIIGEYPITTGTTINEKKFDFFMLHKALFLSVYVNYFAHIFIPLLQKKLV